MKPLNQITPSDIAVWVKGVSPKTWGIIAGAAVGVVGLIHLIFIPAWIERPKIKGQIKSIESQMITTRGLLLRQPELIKNKDAFLKLSEEVKKRLYQPGESSLLLGSISKLAQESSVSVVSSNPKKFEGKFPAPFDVQYEANAYDFTLEGGFHELALFISKIENNSKILRIQTCNVIPQDKTAGKHLAQISLTAVSKKAGAA